MESPSEALPRPTGLPAALSLQPPEATAVNPQLSFLEDGGHVYWFLYLQVCDCYLQGDRLARARCLARFLTWSLATAAELAQALGISARTVTRARLRMQREGESSFGRPRRRRRRHGIEDLGWLRSGGQLRVRQRVATPKRAAPWWRRGPGEVKATSSSSSPLFAFSSAVSK